MCRVPITLRGESQTDAASVKAGPWPTSVPPCGLQAGMTPPCTSSRSAVNRLLGNRGQRHCGLFKQNRWRLGPEKAPALERQGASAYAEPWAEGAQGPGAVRRLLRRGSPSTRNGLFRPLQPGQGLPAAWRFHDDAIRGLQPGRGTGTRFNAGYLQGGQCPAAAGQLRKGRRSRKKNYGGGARVLATTATTPWPTSSRGQVHEMMGRVRAGHRREFTEGAPARPDNAGHLEPGGCSTPFGATWTRALDGLDGGDPAGRRATRRAHFTGGKDLPDPGAERRIPFGVAYRGPFVRMAPETTWRGPYLSRALAFESEGAYEKGRVRAIAPALKKLEKRPWRAYLIRGNRLRKPRPGPRTPGQSTGSGRAIQARPPELAWTTWSRAGVHP